MGWNAEQGISGIPEGRQSMVLDFHLLFTFSNSFDALNGFRSANLMMRDMEEGESTREEANGRLRNVAAQKRDNY